ncbi:MAG: hypothetical protein PHI68_06805, partial [Candidatus Cloacimonetes bacterium]|nr:hypothetical protein [Candidatus Cloacimonadota bacterium]
FLREKIEALHLRILRDPSASYDPRIERLFTAEELTYLKILNHNAFNNLSQVAERLQEAESLPDQLYEEDFSEEEGGEEAQKIMELISEIKEKAQLSILPDSQELGELTLQDLLVGILSRYATDTRLTEISFSDLISVFLELKLPHED